MTDARREALVAAGQQAMAAYFSAGELEGMVAPDVAEMEHALRRADKSAIRILQP